MEWAILLANIALAGLLGRIWLTHLERVQELRGRQEHARLRTEEYLQQTEKAHAATAEAEGQLPELEAQAKRLREEIDAANENLARLKSSEGGLHPSRHQV